MEDEYVLEINNTIAFLNEQMNGEIANLKNVYNGTNLEKVVDISMKIAALKETIAELQRKLKRYNVDIYITKFGTECCSREQEAYLNGLYNQMHQEQKIGR